MPRSDLEQPRPGTWKLKFDKPGYTGDMDVEIREGDTFLAWTASRYDDPTRFPARIKAAATALFAEGLRGSFRISARNDTVEIRRIQA